MDEYTFVIYLTLIAGSLLIFFYFVRAIVLKKQTYDLDKKCVELQELYRKTQLKINQLRSEFGEPQEIVNEGLGGLGIEGILGALNLSPEMLKGLGLPSWLLPIIQGYLSKMKNKGEGGDVTSQKPVHPRQV